MDELEALNLLLRAIGSSPVNSLDTPHPDAANALSTLERIRKQAQLTGWWFNIEYDVLFTPDPTTMQIVVSSKITKLVMQDRHVVLRDRKLYNNSTQTYVFTAAQRASRVQFILPWAEMPVSMQLYVAYFAASQFVRDELEDSTKAQEFREEAANARFDVKKDDLEQGQYNSFDAPRTRRARSGVRPYGRGTCLV